MKQVTSEQDLVSLSVRVRRETAERLKEIADRNDRPVAAQIRRLIQTCVDDDQAAA
jgi:predicted DNA-binding protein